MSGWQTNHVRSEGEGDHFTLEGDMMHLPAGQGMSIYSLGKLVDARCEVQNK